MSRVCLFEIRCTRITFDSNVYGEDIKPNQNSVSSLCVVSQVPIRRLLCIISTISDVSHLSSVILYKLLFSFPFLPSSDNINYWFDL